MKKIILLALALLALQAAPPARAWIYNDGNLLLIFRSPTGAGKDIEYNLGSVSNFLGLATGTSVTNTSWNPTLVTVTGGYGSYSGADFLLLAVTSRTNNPTPTAWITGAEPNRAAYNESLSGFYTRLYSVINAVGKRPLFPSPIPSNNPTAYVIDPSSTALNQYSSYDYIVNPALGASGFSGGNQGNLLPSLGGNAPFVVEAPAIGGQLDFWQVQATTSPTNNPPPDKLIGTFTIDTSNNRLIFVAGPRTTTIGSVGRAGNVSTLTFPTVVGNRYSVVYTNQLGGAVTNWAVDTNTTLVGDGYTDTITHTNSSGTAEFYRIQTQ